MTTQEELIIKLQAGSLSDGEAASLVAEIGNNPEFAAQVYDDLLISEMTSRELNPVRSDAAFLEKLDDLLDGGLGTGNDAPPDNSPTKPATGGGAAAGVLNGPVKALLSVIALSAAVVGGYHLFHRPAQPAQPTQPTQQTLTGSPTYLHTAECVKHTTRLPKGCFIRIEFSQDVPQIISQARMRLHVTDAESLPISIRPYSSKTFIPIGERKKARRTDSALQPLRMTQHESYSELDVTHLLSEARTKSGTLVFYLKVSGDHFEQFYRMSQWRPVLIVE